MTVTGKAKALVKRLLIGRYADWAIEPAMRYMPIVRDVRAHGCVDQVTEIGSGSRGITPYLGHKIVGVDMGFDEPVSSLLEPVCASALDLPFPSSSRPCVVSTDMLEHIPPESRQRAVDELVRITQRLLILAVPAGPGAESQDRALDTLYTEEHGVALPFLTEHVENGLPTAEQVAELVRTSVERSGRNASIAFHKNGNLGVRMWLMRIWIRTPRPSAQWTWTALNHLHPLLSRMNFGECYRTIAVVEFSD